MPTFLWGNDPRRRTIYRASQPFFKSEIGKKWINYEGTIVKNINYRRDRNIWEVEQFGKVARQKYYTPEERYAAQKKRQNEKIKCKCGSIVSQGNYVAHKRTEKHKKVMEILENAPPPYIEEIKELPPPPKEWLIDLQPPLKPKKKKLKFNVKDRDWVWCCGNKIPKDMEAVGCSVCF